MSILDIAQQRNGKLRDGYSVNKAGVSEAKTRVEYGTAQADSSGGFVEILVDNSDESFEVACDAPISSGDRVAYISTNGNGKAVSVSTLSDMAEEVATIVREFSGGVLVAKVGQSYGALVNANGSFDVVELTWSGDVPTIGDTIATFGGTVEIKTPDGNGGYGYLSFDDDGKLTLKHNVSGAWVDAFFDVDLNPSVLQLDNSDAETILRADSYGVTIHGQDAVCSPYKQTSASDSDAALYVSTRYTDDDLGEYVNWEGLPLFKIATYTYTTASTAVSSGGNVNNAALSGDVPSGYKAIAIASIGSNHGQNWYVGGASINVANQTISYSYKHAFGSGSETCTFNFYLLCVPSANVG